jgi:hypothetical protein
MKKLLVAAAVSMMVLSLSSCEWFSNLKPSTPPTSTPPVPTYIPPSPSQSTTPPETAWVRYYVEDSGASFLLPPGWSARNSIDKDWGDLVDYTATVSDSQSKQQLIYIQEPGGIGPSCQPGSQIPITEVDSEEFDIPGYAVTNPFAYLYSWTPPKFTFRVIEEQPGQFRGSLGLNDLVLIGDCLYANGLFGPAKGTEIVFADTFILNGFSGHLFSSLDDASAYMDTEEYKILKRILMSLEFG